MKKTIAAFALVVPVLALTACNTTGTGHIDTDPPYTLERTATHESKVVAVAAKPRHAAPVTPAERVFQRAQTK